MTSTRCLRSRRALRCWPTSTSSRSGRAATCCGSSIRSSNIFSWARADSAHSKCSSSASPASIRRIDMESRSHALMTGVFTVALLVAAVLVGLWLNRDRSAMVPFEIVTTQSIPGLNPQAAVRYRGLEVGRVDDILFDPKVTGQILMRLSVDAGSPITTTTFASLGYQGVTGIAFVQLDDDRTGSPLLRSDAEHPGRIPLRPGLLDQLEKRGLAILEKTERITNSIDKMISP